MKLNLKKYNYIIAFLLLIGTLSSCKDHHNDYIYITLVNNLDKTVTMNIYSTIGGVAYNKGPVDILEPKSRITYLHFGYGYVFKEDEGLTIEVLEVPQCSLDIETEQIPSMEVKGVAMYYSIEELRAMDWTIVYDGNME